MPGDNFTTVGGRTVAIQFVHAALDLARAGGYDAREALEIAAIPAELVSADAARVTEAQAARLVQALWDISDDELVGAGPKPVPRGTFRMMTLGLIHSPTLGDALRRLAEFVGIGMGFEVGLVEIEGGARLVLGGRAHPHLSQPVAAIFLAVVHRFAGWLIGEHIELSSIRLPGPGPAESAEYQSVYGVAPEFGAETAALTFDERYLRSAVVQSEDTLRELIRESPSALLFRQHYRSSAASRVRRILEHSSTPGAVSLQTAAKLLTVSTPHLRRLLHDEGTSFRRLKEDVLRDEAVASLVGGRETVDALSERLGFSEPSAFRRAFRRWTGSPPSSYRGGQ